MWTERLIGAALQRGVFNREVCIVDNCHWTGFEADLLIVEPRLRLIDVEIKITRADLKADYEKDKWMELGSSIKREAVPRKAWPRDVWKHYYAVPADIWHEDLLEHLGSAKSGVLLMSEHRGKIRVKCEKRATPNKAARTLLASEVLDIARLASLRLWNAYEDVRRAADDNLRIHRMYETKPEQAQL